MAATTEATSAEALAWQKLHGFSDPSSVNLTGHRAIHEACALGNIPMVAYFLNHGYTVQTATTCGESWSPLHVALRYGQIETAEFLLTKGSSVDEKTQKGATAMMAAAHKGQVAALDWIFQRMETNQLVLRTRQGSGPVHWAGESGSIETYQWLQSRGCDLNERNANGVTTVFWCALSGHIHALKYLESQGCPINVQANPGETPLMWATEKGQMETVKFLLAKGLDPLHKTSRGHSSIDFALSTEHLDVFLYLANQVPAVLAELKKDARISMQLFQVSFMLGRIDVVKWALEDLKLTCSYELLTSAVKNDHMDMLHYMYSVDHLPFERLHVSSTLVRVAVMYSRIDMLRWLFKIVSSPRVLLELKWTALSSAVTNTKGDVLEMLFNEYSLVAMDFPNNIMEMENVLFRCASRGDVDIMKLLIKAQFDPHYKSRADHTTPIMHAASTGSLEMVCFLHEEMGCTITPPPECRSSAILCGAEANSPAVLDYLYWHGASLAPNAYGISPAQIACKTGSLQALKWLHRHGAAIDGFCDSDASHPVMWAAAGGHIHILQWLSRHGVQLYRENRHGESTYDLARPNRAAFAFVTNGERLPVELNPMDIVD